MQKDSRFFDGIARVASGAVGTVTDLKREVEGIVMDKMEKVMSRMHLVRREEFDVVKAMAEKARAEQEILVKKLAEMEKLLDLQGSKPAPSKKQPKV